MPPTPETPDDTSPPKPKHMYRAEEDRPSRLFQWAVNLPDKFTARKFNGYQLFLVLLLGVLFYFLVLVRFGE